MSDGVYRVGPTPPPTCHICGKEWKDGGRYLHNACLESHTSDAVLRHAAKGRRSWYGSIMWALFVVASSYVIGLGLYCFWMAITASHNAEFCYTAPDGKGTQTFLRASVAWGFDRDIGTFPSLYEAKKAADAIDCPLK